MAKAKPQKIEAYRCPKCTAVLTMTYEQVQAHVDVKVDRHLPVGFTYLWGDHLACIVRGKGSISKSTEPKKIHSYEQPAIVYSFHSQHIVRSLNHLHVYSREIREGFASGECTFLHPESFKILVDRLPNLTKSESSTPLRIKRNCGSLAKLVSTK